MITFTSGDILKSGAEALVNTVNCVGVMGRGVVEFLREDEEKIHALSRIMLHQTGREAAFTPGMVRAVYVLRLRVESISGKLHACPEPPPAC